MYDLDVVSDVVPDVVPHLNGLPSKQFKARIRCGGAANYGPRITEYIAEYYGVFNTAQLHFGHICHQSSMVIYGQYLQNVRKFGSPLTNLDQPSNRHDTHLKPI